MNYKTFILLFIIIVIITIIIGLWPTISKPVVAEKPREMVTGERWLQHLEKDLIPWWLMETAKGEPVGNFPTFRCDNGELVNLAEICPTFSKLGPDDTWITNNLNKKYIVPQSRQVYAYGVAYHLTGNPEFLKLAKVGVDWIREYGLDRENGGAFTYFEGEELRPGPNVLQRTSQDLAYTLLGMAFYYYLTLDQSVLSDIIEIKDFIFENYYNSNQDIMMRQPIQVASEDSEGQWKGLPMQLDQMNTYMMLLTPLLPEPLQSQWKEDLVHLSRIMMNQFYSPEYNIFRFRIDNNTQREIINLNDPGFVSNNNDYGKSIKAFFMIYLTGKMVNNERLISFAQTNASRLLESAYDSDSGTWGLRFILDENGEVINDLDKIWWVYTELDQMAATLSLEDSSYIDKYLKSTVNWWLENMVDHQNHEVWNKLTWPELTPKLPKQYQWKNGFHSHEHVVVGYITAQATQNQPVTLYFARKQGQENDGIRPYYYTGKVTEIKTEPLPSVPEINKVTVTFTDII